MLRRGLNRVGGRWVGVVGVRSTGDVYVQVRGIRSSADNRVPERKGYYERLERGKFHPILSIPSTKVEPVETGRRVSRRQNDRFEYPPGMIPYEDDYIEEPEYPPIDEETHLLTDRQRKRRQEVLDWYQSVQDMPNPEAKTVQFNIPRHYGWRTFILGENKFEYDSNIMYKHFTRSHLVENDLPEIYSSPELTKEAKHFAEKLRGPILEALKFELHEESRSYEQDPAEYETTRDFKRSQSIVQQLNRVILLSLGREVEHLSDCQVDVAPKIEAFWLMGGIPPKASERKKRRGAANIKPAFRAYKGEEDAPMERPLQYKGSPLLQIRCENPIQNFVHQDSPLCAFPPDAPVKFPYCLSNYGPNTTFNYASFIPGTWTSNSHKCSHIAFHPRHHLLDRSIQRSQYWMDDAENALSSQAMLASFGRLLAQAMYYGFDQFSELKYPFSSQTIITDGLKWSFSAYQLNTIHLGEHHMYKNKRQNICWKTKTMNILKESEDGSKTLDNTTLETILKFYLNKPTPIAVENPTPYLKSSLPEWDDEKQREIVFYNYRDMVGQRWYIMESILERQFPEIYEWEYIYKIRHNQRWMDPRRRSFELPPEVPLEQRNPYFKQYNLLNPRFVWKRMKFLMAEVAAKKEQERIEAAKRAESEKYGIVEAPTRKKRK